MTAEVWLEGVPAGDIAPEAWRARVGLLPPESSWWLPLVRDHFRDGVPVPLEHIGLSASILAQPVARLSSGEKQRLALMRLLSNRPRVLLLDEPTANLDPENTRRIEAVITEYRRVQQAAVIWVSHDRQQVARVADRFFEVSGGLLPCCCFEKQRVCVSHRRLRYHLLRRRTIPAAGQGGRNHGGQRGQSSQRAHCRTQRSRQSLGAISEDWRRPSRFRRRRMTRPAGFVSRGVMPAPPLPHEHAVELRVLLKRLAPV